MKALPSSGCPSSERSQIPLPAPLRSTPVTVLRRYYERSDACAGALRLVPEHEHPPVRAGLPASCATPLSPFRLHPPHAPCRRFCTLPHSVDSPATRTPEISPFECRLIDHVRPYRVRHPTDWGLTSDCSPPRLAATQLSLVTGPESGWPGEDLHLSDAAPLQAHTRARLLPGSVVRTRRRPRTRGERRDWRVRCRRLVLTTRRRRRPASRGRRRPYFFFTASLLHCFTSKLLSLKD